MRNKFYSCENEISDIKNHINKYNPNHSHPIFLDLALFLNKQAQYLASQYDLPERFEKALPYYQEAELVYSSIPDLTAEALKQRKWNLLNLRKVGYELQSEKILNEVVQKFESLLQQDEYDHFNEACLETKFHLAFARGDFKEAMNFMQAIMQNSSKRETHFRHMAKVTLAHLTTQVENLDEQRQLMEIVDNYTWQAYDAHKNQYFHALKSGNYQQANTIQQFLISDLMFLFIIRCKKTLLEIDNAITPLDYVLKQANKILRKEMIYNQLVDLLRSKLQFIQEHQYIPFDYQYVTDTQVLNIPISPKQFELMFDNKDALLQHKVIPAKTTEDARFFATASNISNKYQDPLSKPRPWAKNHQRTAPEDTMSLPTNQKAGFN